MRSPSSTRHCAAGARSGLLRTLRVAWLGAAASALWVVSQALLRGALLPVLRLLRRIPPHLLTKGGVVCQHGAGARSFGAAPLMLRVVAKGDAALQQATCCAQGAPHDAGGAAAGDVWACTRPAR